MKVVAFIVCFSVIVVLVLLIIVFTGCAGGGYYGGGGQLSYVPVCPSYYPSQPYQPQFVTPQVQQPLVIDTGFHPAPLIPRP